MDLSDWIHSQADITPDKPAIIFNKNNITYVSLARKIDNYVQILGTELSVKPGDRVAFLGFNSPEMIALLFACARVGAILLPLNWRLAGPEHAQLLTHAKPVVLLVENTFIDHINSFCDQIPEIKLLNLNGSAKESDHRWLSTKQLLLSNQDKPSYKLPDTLNERDGLLLCYTSGTTGVPKGALLSKSALEWNAKNSIHMHQLTDQDTILTLLPMFHVGGLNIQTLPALSVGATVILLDKFDVESFYHNLKQYPVTLTLVVPTVMYAIMAAPPWETLELNNLRIIAIGSSVVPDSLVTAVCKKGIPMIQIYGATETAPIAAYTPTEYAAKKPDSTGKTALHCEIRLVDEHNNEVAQGKKGEILVKGPNVLLEYWQDKKATDESFTDQWFHTGDVGHFDDEGFLYVDGRIKDMIICGGENLYPAAIENVLSQCPEIAEVAIAGKPDDYWGEICIAVVVLKAQSSAGEQQIQDYCSGKIARSSIPKKIVFVEALPRNAMGKVVKESLLDLVSSAV